MMTSISTALEGYALSREQGDSSQGAIVGWVRIDGALDEARWRRAFDDSVNAHEILRTTVQTIVGRSAPVQIVHDTLAAPVHTIDVRGVDRARMILEASARLTAQVGSALSARLDPASGPAATAALVRWSDGQSDWGIAVSTLSADAHSVPLLTTEISQRHAGIDAPEPLQYLEYVAFQEEQLAGEDAHASRDYWHRQSSKTGTFPDLGWGGSSAACDRAVFTLSAETTARLADLAARLQSTPQACLLLCWQALLWRLSGDADVRVDVLSDGRVYPELARVPGPFTRAIPCVTRFDSPHGIADLIGPLHAFLASAREHQYAYDGERAATDAPRSHRTRATFEYVEWASTPEVVPLSLEVHDHIDGLSMRCLRRTSTFDLTIEIRAPREATGHAARIGRAFETFLLGVLDHPSKPFVLHPLIEIGHAPSQTRREQPVDTTSVTRRFEAQADRHPDAMAIMSGDQQITYAALNARANQLARLLRQRGVGPEVLVAVLAEPSIDLIAAILGVLKAGGAYVPLDAASPDARLHFQLTDSRARLVIVSDALRERVAQMGDAIPTLDALRESGHDESTADLPDAPLARATAYVIYTSGSTGRPKGVVIQHDALASYLQWTLDEYAPAGVGGAPLASSLAFDLTITSLFGPLVSGQPVTIFETSDYLASLVSLFRTDQRFSWLKLTPSHVRLLTAQMHAADVSNRTPLLIVGGEAIGPRDLRAWQEAMPEVSILNEYGPTEATVGCCVARLDHYDAREELVPIGHPIAHARMYILDRQHDRLPSGFIGEIAIGGPGLARGYLGRADLTAERFIPDPWASEPGARLYLSGDLGRQRDDQTFDFFGRRDQQVKIRGHRVELGEIEAVLAAYPGVREALVTVREHEGQTSLAAYLRLNPDAAVDHDALRGELRTRALLHLPGHMVPATYTFVDYWPLTTNGKIDRAALPDPDAAARLTAYAAPRTPEEEILSSIWTRVLGAARGGIDDNYFMLGGDSIRAIQIAGLAQDRGLDLTIELLFRHQTIREIAARLRRTEFNATERPRVEPFSLLNPADRALLPDDAEDAFPISALQAGMIFHREYEPESAVYHDIFGYHLRLPLDLDALHAAIQGLIDRHPALRTSFHLTGYSEPIQIVHRTARHPLRVTDIRHLTHAQQHEALLAWMEEEKVREFDYADPPLLWFQVHIRDADSFQFSLSFHHAIIDGWSDATMLIELAISYQAILEGRRPPFEAPATHYREFVALERASAQSDDHRAYWHAKLDQATPVIVPRWPGAAARTGTRGILQRFATLQGAVSDGLLQVARELAVPLKSVLLAAHVRVIGLLGGTRDVLTTITAVGRPETVDGDKVIGLHLNSMPFRIRLSGGTWAQLIRQVFEEERESLPYRRYPLSELQRRHGKARLSETSFYYTHYHIVEQLAQVPGFEIVDRLVYEETSFPLVANFGLDPWTSTVTLNVGCDRRQFTDVQVQRFCEYYERALASIVSDAHGPYEGARLVDGEERETVLATWNDTGSLYDVTRGVHELFEDQAARTPTHTALVAGGESLVDVDVDARSVYTYAVLSERTNRIAHLLRAQGAGPDAPVAICLDRSTEMAVAVLAVLKAGAAYVPLDPAYPRDRLNYMLRDSRAVLVITQRSRRDLLDLDPGVSALVIDDDLAQEAIAACPATMPANRAAPDDLAYIIYTSGSTGRPKGVALTHVALTNLIQWHLEALPGRRRTLQFASLSFDASFHEMFAAWCAGGTLVLIDDEVRRDVQRLARTLRDQRIEKVILPVSVLQQLVLEEPARAGLPALREIIATGERLRVNRAVIDFLIAHPDASLHNHYGPSETHVVTAWTLADDPATCPVSPPIGQPIANSTTYVLDAEMQPVPIGTLGELYLGGVCLARGYVGQPALTAEKFLPNPFARTPGERLYRTGDLAAFMPDATLEFLGRRDDQVKIRGHRVEPGEVEAAVQAHPGVKDVAVVARDDQFGECRLICYFVTASLPAPSVAELRTHLASRVPDYMVPSIFVEMSALPLNANGKVDRRVLPAAEGHRVSRAREMVPPRNGIEEAVCELWRGLLGVDRLGVRDDFFELGGHSLLATRAIADARRVFGVDVPLRQLFERPTVEGLSAAIESALATGDRDPDPLLVETSARVDAADEADGGAVLSAAQERLWIVDQLEGGTSTAYHIAMAVVIEGLLDAAILRDSLRALVARHATLRTRIDVSSGVPRQHVDPPPSTWRLPIVDAYDVVRAALVQMEQQLTDEDSALARFAADEARRPFGLAVDWPFRTTLMRITPTRHVLLLTFHHIAVDGWSLIVLIRELAALYAADGDAAQAGLALLPLQYTDYTRAQRAWLDEGRIAGLLQHWRERLHGAPPQLLLPVDGRRGAGLPRRGAMVPVSVSAATTEALRALARREGATLYMAALAVYAALLGRLADQDDVCIGTPVANRRREEWEGLVGFFVNTLVLRCTLDGRPSFRTLLARVRQTTLDAYAHQDLPFERLVEDLHPPRLPGVQPLMQVMLAWQSSPLASLALPDIELRPLALPKQTAKFDLTLSLQEAEGGLQGDLEYNADLFAHARVKRWAARLVQLIEQVVAEPDRAIADLPIDDGDDQQSERRREAAPIASVSRPGAAAQHGRRSFAPARTRTERLLADLFGGVLGLDVVSVDDSFFELGGDSMQVLQMVARGRSAGLQFTPLQVFEHPTIAQLATVVTAVPDVAVAQALAADENPVGPAPSTPIVAWFFDRAFAQAHHWNQSVMLAPRAAAIVPSVVRDAVLAVTRHHDALRSRFTRGDSGIVEQIVMPPAPSVAFAHIDLRALTDSGASRVVERLADAVVRQAQASLSLEDGRVLQAVWIDGRDATDRRLALIAHHLVIDGYSWRVLLEDFERAIADLARGDTPSLPAKTSAWRQWTQALQATLASDAARVDAPFWCAQIEADAPPLPRELHDGPNVAASTRTVDFALSHDETIALLRHDAGAEEGRLPRRAGAAGHVEEALLAALTDALRRWNGCERLLIALEHHGRSTSLADALSHLDVSRTIGWFTALYPLCLDVRGAATPAAVLRQVRAQRRAVPRHGTSFGVLRYLDPDAALRDRLAARTPDVSFTYLGQFDGALASGAFDYVGAPAQPCAPDSLRPYLLDITSSVWQGRLGVTIAYSAACHSPARVEALGRLYLDAIRQFMRPGLEGSEPVEAAADVFPDAGLDPDSLERFIAGLEGTSRS
jgi:amino acid adenylation domain-containing protein/non-ribosomal peptide synthase protein (TIGR01720 family)